MPTCYSTNLEMFCPLLPSGDHTFTRPQHGLANFVLDSSEFGRTIKSDTLFHKNCKVFGFPFRAVSSKLEVRTSTILSKK